MSPLLAQGLNSPPHALFLRSGIQFLPKAEKLDPKDIVTLEELAISSMWEMAELVEVLEKKGLLTKQDILEAIRELRKKNPLARIPVEFDDHPEPAFP